MAANPESIGPSKSLSAAVKSANAALGSGRRQAHITELVPASLRHDMITLAAYHRSAERGFAPGYELDDWLAAERDVDATLRSRYT